MLNQHVNAIYENGVLRPLQPLDLAEHELVSLVVGQSVGDETESADTDDYAALIADEGDPNVSWEQVQAVLAKLPSSLAEDFVRERDERS